MYLHRWFSGFRLIKGSALSVSRVNLKVHGSICLPLRQLSSPFALPCMEASHLGPFLLSSFSLFQVLFTSWSSPPMTNLIHWTKGRNLMPSDEILMSLGLSNICFSTAKMLDYFFSLVWEEFYSTFYHMQKLMFGLDIATSFSSFWFTALLSIFYCMKIVTFKQPFLLVVKRNFSGLARWLLLASLLVSWGTTLLILWAFRKESSRKPAAMRPAKPLILPPTPILHTTTIGRRQWYWFISRCPTGSLSWFSAVRLLWCWWSSAPLQFWTLFSGTPKIWNKEHHCPTVLIWRVISMRPRPCWLFF